MYRIKKKLSRLLFSVILLALITFYAIDFVTDKSNLHNVEIKMKLIEDELFLRQKELKIVKDEIKLIGRNDVADSEDRHDGNERNVQRKGEYGNCTCSVKDSQKVDIEMLDLYKDIPFTNADGGEWTQGWQIKYNSDDFNEANKLKVFVVPHSHNDPGWLRTYDEYYERTTKYILYSMVNFLSSHNDMKFVWAEISFFSRWFEKLPPHWKRNIKQMVDRGQLEFVTGGWVMPDEANSHWLGVTIQLIEGQNWLKKHLNVKPKSGWAIDPFGHSATMPFLLKKSNLKNILIQRTHYEVKKRLAQDKSLEFHWRQIWDKSGKTDMFTHMMPFLSYGAPYSCGPDPRICCQFDFERLPDKGRTCKWGVQPEEITDENVVQKAQLLLDQWRKKSTLYKTRSLLVPLGDDFRYTTIGEWEDQYKNYKKLFNYLNSRKDLFVQAKFATLGEYFDSVHQENQMFPSLSGDFFTYADRDDHYWSGYYTSRPYYKRMDRVLIHYLRSAEMLYSWNNWQSNAWLERRLRNATQALSLFQHHDGITGTAREHVVQDYAQMLNFGVRSCKFVMQQAVYRLLMEPEIYKPDFKRTYFELDESHWPGLGDDVRPTIIINKSNPRKYVAFHNSLPQWREELVELQVSTPYIKVTDIGNRTVLAQISPVWSWDNLFMNIITPRALTSKFILHFKVKVPPLGLTTYVINLASKKDVPSSTTFSKITIMTEVPFFVSLSDYPLEVQFAKLRNFHVQTSSSNVSFTKHGFLKIISGEANFPHVPIHIEFLKYGTKSWFADERSGAYLFLPNGPAKPLRIDNPTVLISEGVLETSVSTGLPFVIHKTILRDDDVEMRNYVNIGDMGNQEIVMRLTTNIMNGHEFYTDLNGFQILKRVNLNKLPLQGNYYPVPSSIYIEDELTRLTLLSAQPLGGSSLTSGQIDIMQDRRLKQSDGRGLGEGVLDNKPVLHIFRLIVESRRNCPQQPKDYAGGSLTANAHRQLQSLLHPIDKFIFKEQNWPGMKGSFGADHHSLDDDFEIGMLQHLPEVYQVGDKRTQDRVGLIMHRTQIDECDISDNYSGKINIRNLLGLQNNAKIFSSPLTFVETNEKITTDHVDFCPMEIKSFVIQR